MTTHPRQSSVRNRLLSALPSDDFARIGPHLERVDVVHRQTLIAPNEPITRLYFPESGFAFIVADGDRGMRAEIGLIGREGLVGATPILLGTDRTPDHVFVQNGGQMFGIAVSALTAAMDDSPTLHRMLLRFVQVHVIHLSQAVYSHVTATMEVRLARLLLMCHDRIDGDEIVITHEFLAMMLGVQRPGATLAVQMLEQRLLIKAQRGRIIIVGRAALLAFAGGGYGIAEAEYARLIAPLVGTVPNGKP